MALTLLKEKRFPDYGTYKGSAQEDAIEYYSLSLLDPTWLIDGVIASKIEEAGYKPIRARVYRETVYNVLGYDVLYHYRLEYVFHGSPSPAVETIIMLILAILLAYIIYLILTQVRDIIWPPGAPPIIPIALLLIAGSSLVGAIGTAIASWRSRS